MALIEQIQADLTAAMKAKQEPERTVLRSLSAALQNAQIAAGGKLDEAAATAVIAKQLKQREESAEAAASRPELAQKEQAEGEIIKRYLPEPLSESDLTDLVVAAIKETGASSPADMGKVMGVLKAKTAGRADQSALATLVKERLSA